LTTSVFTCKGRIIGRIVAIRIAGRAGLLAFLLLLAGAGLACADNGPHTTAGSGGGTSPILADACATCHRAHTSTSSGRRTPDQQLCFACHGTSAAGATTNVEDGQLAGTGHGLRGGGFVNAQMDTAWTGAATLRPVTSMHQVMDGATGTMWGSGPLGSGSGAGAANVALGCLSCHDPHGNGNYRILRSLPQGAPSQWPITVADQTVKGYGVSSADDKYFGEVYAGGDYQVQAQLTRWCAACHTRMDAEAWSSRTPSGDNVHNYRHSTRVATDDVQSCAVCHSDRGGTKPAPDPFKVTEAVAHVPICLSCHVAHGTAAVMGQASSQVLYPGEGPAATPGPGLLPTPGTGLPPTPNPTTTPPPTDGGGHTALLRLDNRGVCGGCHVPTTR
jgi:predicted CXXCH cytochrome family protein